MVPVDPSPLRYKTTLKLKIYDLFPGIKSKLIIFSSTTFDKFYSMHESSWIILFIRNLTMKKLSIFYFSRKKKK